MFLLGIMLGIIIGMLSMAYIFVDIINEKDSLVNESRQALRNTENEVVALVKENRQLYIENKDLRFENEELTHNIKKELVTDSQSEN